MPSLASAQSLRRSQPFGQFGQANCTLSNGGATGCTDTSLQFVTLLLKAVLYTHDQIRKTVGHLNKLTGLNSSEVQTWMRTKGLPYQVRFDLSADQMLAYSKRGPVLVAEQYSHHPEWMGYRYGGLTADGKPNGYAKPLRAAGKNQLTGFTGRHMTVLLGVHPTLDEVYIMEPNHGSGARPQKVAYDVITKAQFRVLVAAYKNANGGGTYSAIPTKQIYT